MKMEANEILKKITEFNVEDNFYDADEKKEVIKQIKDLMEIDEPKVREFLTKWIESAKTLADEMDLTGDESEEDKEDEGSEEDKKEDAAEEKSVDGEDEFKPEEETETKSETVKLDKPQITETEYLNRQANRYLM